MFAEPIANTVRRCPIALLALAFHILGFTSLLPAQATDPCEYEYTYTTPERVEDYLDRTLGPESLFQSAALAGLDQLRDRPDGWGQGAGGYGQRIGSRLARQAIGNTAQLAVESILNEDSRYTPSEDRGAWKRATHSLTHTFFVKTPSGRRAPPLGRIANALSSGLISRAWYPEGDNTWEDGARSAGISLGIYTGVNVFREFWPDIKKIFGK